MWFVIQKRKPFFYHDSPIGAAIGTWIGILVLALYWT